LNANIIVKPKNPLLRGVGKVLVVDEMREHAEELFIFVLIQPRLGVFFSRTTGCLGSL
jgi:hypothetical protein